MSELAKLDRIRTELAQAKDLMSIVAIRDKAEAVRTYAKAAKLGRDIHNDAGEIKIEAEAKAGELLKAMEKHKGGRPPKNHLHDEGGFKTLDALGIDENQSIRWQRVASVPKEDRATYYREARESGEVTSAGVLRVERKLRKASVKTHKTPEIPKGKYRTIVIDPPWPMQKIDREVRPNQAAFDYPVMTLEEIERLPVEDLSASNSHLYLWTTQKFLPSTPTPTRPRS